MPIQNNFSKKFFRGRLQWNAVTGLCGFNREGGTRKKYNRVKLSIISQAFVSCSILLMVILLAFPSIVHGYGKTHSYITKEAFQTWPKDCGIPIYAEFCEHRHPKDFNDYWNLLEHQPLGDEYLGNTILEGAVEEDYGSRTISVYSYTSPYLDLGIGLSNPFELFCPVDIGHPLEYLCLLRLIDPGLNEWVDHFWDPVSNMTMNKSDRIFSVVPESFVDYSMTAFQKAAFMFTLAYFYYKYRDTLKEGFDGKSLGYYYLGRTAHLLQDMAVPAHVNQDVHILQGPLANTTTPVMMDHYGYFSRHFFV